MAAQIGRVGARAKRAVAQDGVIFPSLFGAVAALETAFFDAKLAKSAKNAKRAAPRPMVSPGLLSAPTSESDALHDPHSD
jgi:hypothetical protein